MNKAGFEKYVGKKVLVNETKRTLDLKILGPQEFIKYDIADEDTVIKEIQAAHSHVRVWLPNTMGTMDYRLDRLNVTVAKQDDGSFEITKVYLG